MSGHFLLLYVASTIHVSLSKLGKIEFLIVNSLTLILVLAGTKNYHSIEFPPRNSTFFAFFETQHNPQPPPQWWAVRPSYGID